MLLSTFPIRTLGTARHLPPTLSRQVLAGLAGLAPKAVIVIRPRTCFSTNATDAFGAKDQQSASGQSRSKSIAIGSLTAATAVSALVYFLKSRTSTEPTTLSNVPLSSLSAQDQYIHSTLTQHAQIHAHPALKAQIHSTYVASNNPIEDRLAITAMPKGKQLLVSVFDGHAGWQCAHVLKQWYANYVARIVEMRKYLLGEAMGVALDEFDADLMGLPNEAKNMETLGMEIDQVREILLPAMAGSVVVSAMIDETSIHVANAGDSRAVIGRRTSSSPGWTAVPLTIDHNAENPAEVARLKREHPGEEDTVITDQGRVIRGLNVFRSAGDGRFKWAKDVREWVCGKFVGSEYKYSRDIPWSLSPPYITAKSEVVRHVLEDGDEFLVMATDGLWEHATNDQVVASIGAYLDRNNKSHRDAERAGPDDAKWALQDRNAAAHTIRNAIGGQDSDKVAHLFKIPHPESRDHRDDISVVVVFLGKALDKLPGVQGAVQTVPVADPNKGKMKVSMEKGLYV
ncbi:phosphatase 2C-like domain-containing protein [Catenaria anguillulae PL171]|uniref:Phosphatase 2C-like domain-containing protein n=1 Tax=Catenaria anguillulae PL171 TaxID=765915 RepID=A0A1Y2HI29_9FUNG|nr:phosphatase 2C-like domain-containing protein [Catenaria anguillulae PL171]